MTDIDIDPDAPLISQEQKKQELMAKWAEIEEKAEREQILLLYNDREKYLEIYKQLKKWYNIRILGCVISILGAIALAAIFIVHYTQTLSVTDGLNDDCTWSEWEPVLLNSSMQTRFKCSFAETAPLICPQHCKYDNNDVYTSLEEIKVTTKGSIFAKCENTTSSAETYIPLPDFSQK